MFTKPTIVERMQNVGRISLVYRALQNTPYTKNLKYLKMTIVARAHNLPVGSQIKPNEYFRCQAKQTVYKDGSETVTAHLIRCRLLVKLR